MKYKIKVEIMGCEYYYMICQKLLFWWVFIERWDTLKSANKRIRELEGHE